MPRIIGQRDIYLKLLQVIIYIYCFSICMRIDVCRMISTSSDIFVSLVSSRGPKQKGRKKKEEGNREEKS